MKSFFRLTVAMIPLACGVELRAQDVKQTDAYKRILADLEQVSAIDTHDHLRPFELLVRDKTPEGPRVTLRAQWAGSYFSWTSRVEPWPDDMIFDHWWQRAKPVFADARATSFYRYMLPAFQDLYGVDFNTITDEQARDLNNRIIANYADQKWQDEVITEKARIELMVDDPYWGRLDLDNCFPAAKYIAPVLNVTTIITGHHPSRSEGTSSPYWFAEKNGMNLETFDDYLAVVSAAFDKATAVRAVAIKSTQAYERTLYFEKVPQDRAAKAFGKSWGQTTEQERKDFEDFMFWHVASLAAKHDFVFQIHTGQARVQGSNPLLLSNLIEGNPRTRFALFHGGYPWVGETGVMAQRFRNVWIDSNWLPQLNYSMARRAYLEWLDAVPSTRILWGADNTYAEGIYGATVTTRRCIAEALAEKTLRGEIREVDATRIGRQIMRDNALALMPGLKDRLWRK